MTGEAIGEVRLFVSHHSSTYATALEVEALLAERGVNCWIAPRDVEPGEPFDKAISRAILGSAGILLLFCEKSDESRHVKRELILADSASRPIIPLRLEAISPRELAYHLADSQWIDWIDRREAVMDRVAAQARQYAAALPVIDGPLPQTHRAAVEQPDPAPARKLGWAAAALAGVLAIVALTWFLATRDRDGGQAIQSASTPAVAQAQASQAAMPAGDQGEAPAAPVASAEAQPASPVGQLPRSTGAPAPTPTPAPAVAAGGALQRVVDACRGAASDAEYLICADPALESRAREIGALIDSVRTALADEPAALRQFNTEQRSWFNSVRSRCSTAACIVRAQEQRSATLREILERRG